MRRSYIVLITSSIFLFSAILSACKKELEDEIDPEAPYVLNIPKGFPQPVIPADNELTHDRVNLGKRLFFDPILSRDTSISCGSCHNQANAFSDPNQFSSGVGGANTTRNSMALINLAWSSSFFWDGGVSSLELQVMAPITNHLEMDLSLTDAIQRLKEHPEYPALFLKAYNRQPDLYSLFRAIAAYERTLISGNSRFDQYFYQGNANALNDSEKRGLDLFYGDKVHCASCHTGVNFTNNSFQNNGLYSDYPDEGRFIITNNPSDKGKFKVPTLRNVELTAPYMHDGSLATLEDVIDHYNSGGQNHPNKSLHVHIHSPLNVQEKIDLINFLKSLTDTEFITNPSYQP